MVDATTIVRAPGPTKLWLTEGRFLRGPPLFVLAAPLAPPFPREEGGGGAYSEVNNVR